MSLGDRLLEHGRPVILDGGMGQELAARGVDTTTGLWSAHALEQSPETVVAVHRDFIDAGADVITTNSYASTRRRLEAAGEGAAFERYNRRAGELAQRARSESGREVAIAGCLPPLWSYRPERAPTADVLEPIYREQARLLAEYADLMLCETLSSVREATAAARAAVATGLPTWVAWSVADDGTGRLRSGESIEAALGAVDDLGVGAVLLNCSMPESIDAALPALVEQARVPAGAYANGFTAIGSEHDVADGRNVPDRREDMTPDRYAEIAARWVERGLAIVGGCCEVGPDHIARLSQRVRGGERAAG